MKIDDLETNRWVDEHWKDQWKKGSGDRWDAKNQELGWSLEEIKQEFDDFFSEHDATLITDVDHEDREKLDVELRKTLELYDLGVQSGKISNADAIAANSGENTRF